MSVGGPQPDIAHGPGAAWSLEDLPDFEERAQRTDHDILITQQTLLEEILAELRHIRAAQGTTSQSSVELSENAKGGVQLTVKVYADSPIQEAAGAAIAEFAVLKQEIERQQMQGWNDTIDSLKAAS